ncbi:serine hydrolase, partial [Streptomyces sp. ZEA17I]
MSTPHGLQDLLDTHTARGSAPGAVALVARGDRRGQGGRGERVEVAVAGSATL